MFYLRHRILNTYFTKKYYTLSVKTHHIQNQDGICLSETELFMKRRILSCLIFSMMLCSILLCTSSCFVIEQEPEELCENDTVIQGGATNTIYINTTDSVQTIAASKALLSTVSISSTFEIEYDSFFTGPYVQDAKYSGSGVIYKLDKTTGDAYVITNYHVVYNSASTSESGI